MKQLDFTKDIEFGFVIEAMKDSTAVDFNNLNTAYMLMMNKTTESIAEKIRTDILTKYIDSCRESFLNISAIDVNQLINFFSAVYTKSSGDEVNLSIKVRNVSEIDKIKPQYLLKITTDLKIMMDKLFQGTEPDYFDDPYKSESYVNRIKRDMVKTSLPVNLSKQQIMSSYSDTNIEVTEEFIQSTIIPFIRNLPILSKSIEADISNTQTNIRKAEEELNICIAATNRMIASSNIDIKRIRKIHKFLYNMISNFMTCASYLTLMLIRKVNAYTFNIIAFRELYGTIRGFYPEAYSTVTESTDIEDEIKSLDDIEVCDSILTNNFGILRRFISNITLRERDTVSVSVHKKIGTNIMNEMDELLVDHPYNDTVYHEIAEIFKDIQNKINVLNVKLLSGVGLNESLEEAEIDESFETMYVNYMAKIDDIGYYIDDINQNKNDVMLSVYKELSSAETNILNICQSIVTCKKTINDILEEFEKQTNIESTKIEIDDIIDFIKNTLLIDFSHLCVYIGRKLISRYVGLCDLLKDLTTDVPEIDDIEYTNDEDYMRIEMESVFDIIDTYTEMMYTESVAELDAELQYIKRGVTMVYEAGIGSINTESVKVFFEKLITDFKKKATDMISRHGKWIEEEESKLLSLDTNGISIDMLPYKGFNPADIPGLIKKAAGHINTLNPATMYQHDRNTVKNQIFDFIPSAVDAPADDLSLRTKTFFTIGTAKNKTTKISGQKVSARIKDMIQYCKDYDGLTRTIESSLKTFVDAVDRKVAELNKTSKALSTQPQTVKESTEDDFYLEADQQGEQQTANKGDQSNQATSTKPVVKVDRPTATSNGNVDNKENVDKAVKSSKTNNSKHASELAADARIFSRCTIIAVETRYVDYINTLRSLIAKTKS